jgi:4-amino-4-deoxy-L-arabinose transferase-like glycosyltransferase
MSDMSNAEEHKAAREPGNVTLFRTTNFFVHAFTPALKTGTLQKASGNATILERIRWTSVEKQRMMAAQTRLLPQNDTVNAAQWHEITIPAGLEALVVALVLCVTFIVQTINIFNYPAYTADEGASMANAWALLHGHLAPFVYTYDQPPLGWVQIAGWLQLTGGFVSFGNAINSGRVLMLALACASSLLLYLVTSRLSGSRSAALLAMIIYSLSPLSLIYRREVLLDNIGIFWLLLSLCLITTARSNLRTFVLAAMALGIAILTEDVFACFLPVVLYTVWLYATPFQRKFSLLTFLYVVLVIASTYVLLALLKGELFPAAILPGGGGARVSLIGALLQKWQAPLAAGQFAGSWQVWLRDGALFLTAGIIATFINILGGVTNRFQLQAALLSASMCIVLLISPSVQPYSILPLLPCLALNIVVAFNTPLRWLTRKTGFDLGRALLCFVLIGMLIPASIQQALPLLAQHAAAPQQQAMLWMRDNAPHTSVVISPSYMYSDLHEQGGMAVGSGTPFARAYIYSNVLPDSQISTQQLRGNWQNINFLIVDAAMLKEIRSAGQYELLNQAIHHAIVRASFGSGGDGTQIQVYQVLPPA